MLVGVCTGVPREECHVGQIGGTYPLALNVVAPFNWPGPWMEQENRRRGKSSVSSSASWRGHASPSAVFGRQTLDFLGFGI